MTNKITGVFLLFLFGRVLSQYDTVYLESNTPTVTYDKTREEIISNFLNNKPLLNYVPVYNTDYGLWEGEKQKLQEDALKKPQFVHTQTFHLSQPTAQPEFQKLDQVISRLRTDMQNLSQKTRHVYENKLKELHEVKKLNDNLKVALRGTDVLKNSLHQNEKHFIELTKNPQNANGYTVVSPAGADQFLKMIEGLESMVRNINYKNEGKPAM